MTSTPPALASTLSDEDVIKRVVGGEPALFELLMRRHNRRAFRTARALTATDHDAEDVMQEAYVRAFSALPRFEGRSSFATWLTRIVVMEGLARKRRSSTQTLGTQEEADSMSDPSQSSPEHRAFQREVGGLLERAVETLPDAFRLVFVLRAVEQLSVRDVAESLDLSEETVKTRYFRAKEQLRQRLDAHLETSGPDLYGFHLSRCDRVVSAVLARLELTPLT